ncbi:MAG: hypothetical protein KatS3mg112_1799 [Thermogutta sp.]|nr:MAG: hypothetical protein KatS3mg112_1799 [Thermogutta sp.]
MVPVLSRTHKNRLGASCLLVIVLFGIDQIAQGGGGPENVLLVVNPNSPVSLAVANLYQSLRQIPDSNVLYIPWDPREQVTDIDRFREKILLPIIEHLTRQGALEWIDCVAYSADFPWGIDLRKDIERIAEEHPELLPPARPGRSSDEGKKGRRTGVCSLAACSHASWIPERVDLSLRGSARTPARLLHVPPGQPVHAAGHS